MTSIITKGYGYSPSGGGGGGGLTPEQSAMLELIAARIMLLGTQGIITSSPVAQGGDVALLRGFDYTDESGLALWFSSDGWVDLTGASIDMVTESGAIVGSGGIVASGGDPQSVSVSITSMQSSDLEPGQFGFVIRATLPGGAKVPLVSAVCRVS